MLNTDEEVMAYLGHLSDGALVMWLERIRDEIIRRRCDEIPIHSVRGQLLNRRGFQGALSMFQRPVVRQRQVVVAGHI